MIALLLRGSLWTLEQLCNQCWILVNLTGITFTCIQHYLNYKQVFNKTLVAACSSSSKGLHIKMVVFLSFPLDESKLVYNFFHD